MLISVIQLCLFSNGRLYLVVFTPTSQFPPRIVLDRTGKTPHLPSYILYIKMRLPIVLASALAALPVATSVGPTDRDLQLAAERLFVRRAFADARWEHQVLATRAAKGAGGGGGKAAPSAGGKGAGGKGQPKPTHGTNSDLCKSALDRPPDMLAPSPMAGQMGKGMSPLGRTDMAPPTRRLAWLTLCLCVQLRSYSSSAREGRALEVLWSTVWSARPCRLGP